MPYALRSGLSYCEVDGKLVFLDLTHDRYFLLQQSLAAALVPALQGAADQDRAIDALVAKDIVVWAEAAACPSQLLDGLPSRSVLESCAATTPQLRTVVEVAALVSHARLQLKTRPLDQVLTALESFRRSMTDGKALPEAGHVPDQLIEAAAVFRDSRAFVPLEPCCLPDSIALVRFLAKRRMPAALTFAVALDPFAAHCWVQFDDWVLNDTVGNALAHTPIRSL